MENIDKIENRRMFFMSVSLVLIFLLVPLIAFLVRMRSVRLAPRAWDYGARFSLVADKDLSQLSTGDEFVVQAWLNTCHGQLGCADTRAAGLKLVFDTNYLEVVAVEEGDLYGMVAARTYDNSSGNLELSMVNLPSDSPYNSNGTAGLFGKFTFRALAPVASTLIGSTFKPQTTTDHCDVVREATSDEDILEAVDPGAGLEVAIDAVATPTITLTPSPTLTITPSSTPTAEPSLQAGAVMALVLPEAGYFAHGQSFDVEVRLATGNNQTTGADVVIAYDKSRLVPENIISAGAYDFLKVNDNPLKDNWLDFTLYSVVAGSDCSDCGRFYNSGLDEGLIATVQFRVLDTAKSGKAKIGLVWEEGLTTESNVLLYQTDASGQPMPIDEAKDILVRVGPDLKVGIKSVSCNYNFPRKGDLGGAGIDSEGMPVPDCCVNGADISIMVAYWGDLFFKVNDRVKKTVAGYADLQKDFKINGADISVLIHWWGCES